MVSMEVWTRLLSFFEVIWSSNTMYLLLSEGSWGFRQMSKVGVGKKSILLSEEFVPLAWAVMPFWSIIW